MEGGILKKNFLFRNGSVKDILEETKNDPPTGDDPSFHLTMGRDKIEVKGFSFSGCSEGKAQELLEKVFSIRGLERGVDFLQKRGRICFMDGGSVNTEKIKCFKLRKEGKK